MVEGGERPLTLVDDVSHSLSTESVVQWNQNSRVIITRLFSHHPLQRERREGGERGREGDEVQVCVVY